jgi:N-acetylated-alpha-linked acidic dipeptidase
VPSFDLSIKAADRLASAGHSIRLASATATPAQLLRVNAALLTAERAMLGAGLPHRTWFRHTIYAPGEYTGYAAVVIPGVNESMDRNDPAAAADALNELTNALQRAATVLESAL